MSKAKKRLIITGLAVLIAVLGVFIWYIIPVTLPGGISASDVNEIMVFDNTTGRRVYIRGRGDIEEIVGGFQSVKMRRDGGLFGSPDGPSFTIDFRHGGKAESFMVYGSKTVKAAFEYKADEAIPCYGRIMEMLVRVRDTEPGERDIQARLCCKVPSGRNEKT